MSEYTTSEIKPLFRKRERERDGCKKLFIQSFSYMIGVNFFSSVIEEVQIY